jgi:hypothetical protein
MHVYMSVSVDTFTHTFIDVYDFSALSCKHSSSRHAEDARITYKHAYVCMHCIRPPDGVLAFPSCRRC